MWAKPGSMPGGDLVGLLVAPVAPGAGGVPAVGRIFGDLEPEAFEVVLAELLHGAAAAPAVRRIVGAPERVVPGQHGTARGVEGDQQGRAVTAEAEAFGIAASEVGEADAAAVDLPDRLGDGIAVPHDVQQFAADAVDLDGLELLGEVLGGEAVAPGLAAGGDLEGPTLRPSISESASAIRDRITAACSEASHI